MAAPHVLAITTPLVAGAMGVGAVRTLLAMRALSPPPLAAHSDEGATPWHGDNPLTAAVLLDHAGTEVSDFLLPLELPAASGAFNVYATASESRPATLAGGLDVMPHLSHAAFERLSIVHADLIVVPYTPQPDAAVSHRRARHTARSPTRLTTSPPRRIAYRPLRRQTT